MLKKRSRTLPLPRNSADWAWSKIMCRQRSSSLKYARTSNRGRNRQEDWTGKVSLARLRRNQKENKPSPRRREGHEGFSKGSDSHRGDAEHASFDEVQDARL